MTNVRMVPLGRVYHNEAMMIRPQRTAASQDAIRKPYRFAGWAGGLRVPFFKGFRPAVALAIMALGCRIASASAANIYIAQNAAGTANGSTCANAYAVAFFNTAANWGSGSTQIGPGTTVHVCGTLTASAGASGYLTFQGSGVSGSPVTLKLEAGAIVQAPYWGANGAIYASGKSYITIDGGTNGLIQATLNGTSGGTCPGGACQYQQGIGEAIYLTGCNTVEIKNLTIGDLYDHTSISDTIDPGLHNPWGIGLWGGDSNITVDNNTIHDVNWAVFVETSSGSPLSNLDFHSNQIYNVSLGIGGGDGSASATITGPVNIYNNVIHDMAKWDANGDVNHHDAVYIWLTNSSSSFTGPYNVYNNQIYNLGTTCSTPIYFDSGASTTYPAASAFNNVIDAGTCGDGAFYDKSGKMHLYNNTILVGTINSQGGSSPVQMLENNISGATEGLLFGSASASASDYNNWYNLNNPAFTYNNTSYSSLAAFHAATGFEAHSIPSTPSLSSSSIPNSGSPVIGTGINLTTICSSQPNPGLGALCYDKAGNARPATGGWDMGAYNGQQSTTTPAPPTSLTATVK